MPIRPLLFVLALAVPLLSAARPVIVHADDLDSREAVGLLQELIRIPTVNPPGNESALTHLLADRFQAAGMAVELTGVTTDRQNLIVTVPGTRDTQPWLILAHVDTVPADPSEWAVDPFAGKISDGVVWGRGALDNKGMTAALTTALLRLQRSGMLPEIPLTVIYTVDEETGSALGLHWLAEQRPELYEVRGVLNEGGFVIRDPEGPAQTTYYVSVGEKGIAWLRLRARGTTGHGSIRWGNNANDKLVMALQKLATWEHEPMRNSPLAQYAMNDLGRRGEMARSTTEAMRRHPLAKQIARDPALASSLRNTCNITVLEAGARPNVIPGVSEATVDCRIIPGETPEGFVDKVRTLLADFDVEVELLTESMPNVSPWRTGFFASIERIAKEADPDSMVVPVLSPGATDSRFWRERGVPSYGIVPIPISPEMVSGMHGPNERVPASSVEEAADFLEQLLWNMGRFRTP